MAERLHRYHSFLLRLWREAEHSENWRASLQEVKTERVIGFGTLKDLLVYLEWLAQHEEHELNNPMVEENESC